MACGRGVKMGQDGRDGPSVFDRYNIVNERDLRDGVSKLAALRIFSVLYQLSYLGAAIETARRRPRRRNRDWGPESALPQ